MTTSEGVHSTRDGGAPAVDSSQIDQIRGDLQAARDLGFNAAVGQVIDREADSVDHRRQARESRRPSGVGPRR